MIVFDILLILGLIYLLIGIIYATYILFFGADVWYWYVVNVAFGPVVLIYNLFVINSRINRKQMYKDLILGKKAALFGLEDAVTRIEEVLDRAMQEVLLRTETPWVGVTTAAGLSVYDRWVAILAYNRLGHQLSAADLTEHTYTVVARMIKEQALDALEGLWAFVVELKHRQGFKLGIISNYDRRLTNIIVDHLGLREGFELVLDKEDVKAGKPSKDLYDLATSKLNLKKREIIVFESTLIGAQAANKAGLDTVVVWDEQTPQNDFPRDVISYIPSYDELADSMRYTLAEQADRYKTGYEEFKKGQQNTASPTVTV